MPTPPNPFFAIARAGSPHDARILAIAFKVSVTMGEVQAALSLAFETELTRFSLLPYLHGRYFPDSPRMQQLRSMALDYLDDL
jgi:hypothetical protein